MASTPGRAIFCTEMPVTSLSRKVPGAHGPEIGHFKLVDYVLAGDVTHQANSRKSLYQDGVLDSGLLLKDYLDDFLIHAKMLGTYLR